MQMSNFFETIKKGLEAVAPVAANFVVPGSGSLVASLMRKVTGDDTQTPIEDVAKKIADDPALYIELQKAVMTHEASLAEIDARKLETVNATMREESKSEHWPQYSWRPFNGFMFPLTFGLVYFLLPLLDKTIPSIPELAWVGWLSILGVATWDRGKQKRAEIGEQRSGLIDTVVKAIRGNQK
jgi:hypothetical protein